jgi:hypothetical protein
MAAIEASMALAIVTAYALSIKARRLRLIQSIAKAAPSG